MFKNKFLISVLIFILLILLFPMFANMSFADSNEFTFKYADWKKEGLFDYLTYDLAQKSGNTVAYKYTWGTKDFRWFKASFSEKNKTMQKDRDLYWYLTYLTQFKGTEKIDYEDFIKSEFVNTVLNTPRESTIEYKSGKYTGGWERMTREKLRDPYDQQIVRRI